MEEELAQVAEQIKATESEIADLQMQLAFVQRALAVSTEMETRASEALEEALHYAELARGEMFYPER